MTHLHHRNNTANALTSRFTHMQSRSENPLINKQRSFLQANNSSTEQSHSMKSLLLEPIKWSFFLNAMELLMIWQHAMIYRSKESNKQSKATMWKNLIKILSWHNKSNWSWSKIFLHRATLFIIMFHFNVSTSKLIPLGSSFVSCCTLSHIQYFDFTS